MIKCGICGKKYPDPNTLSNIRTYEVKTNGLIPGTYGDCECGTTLEIEIPVE